MQSLNNVEIRQQPAIGSLQPGMAVEGIYRVAMALTVNSDGWTGRLVRLSDGYKSLSCLIETDADFELSKLRCRAVRVRFATHQSPRYGLTGRIEALEVMKQVPDELVLDLLPCPKKHSALLERTRMLVNSLPSMWRAFVIRVLSNDKVARAFFVTPSSRTYHHTERGGLARHSLELAEAVGRYGDLAAHERELVQVAALMHDLGKTRTLNFNGYRTAAGKLVTHESRLGELCADALGWLDEESPSSANLLRHLWTAAYPGQHGIKPATPLVDVLRRADRNSARQDQYLRRNNLTPGMSVPA